jgi:hypothetical protein
MNLSRSLARLRRMIADLSNPASISYFILIHQNSFQFVRISGRCLTVRPESSSESSESQNIASFLSQVVKGPLYYGQPIGLLLDSLQSFSFIKQYENSQTSKIRDDLKSLSTSGVVVNHVLRTGKDSTLVVAQGIDSEFLQGIVKTCNQVGLNLLYVSTLPAYLALNAKLLDRNTESLSEFLWSASQVGFLGSKADGTVCYVSIRSLAGEDHRTKIASLLFGHELAPTVSRFIAYPKKQDKPLGSLFRRGHNIPRQDRILFKTAPTSRMARGTLVMSNSLKLLTGILATLLVVVCAFWLVYHPSNSPVSPAEEKYQTAYSDNLQLQRTVDSLNSATHHQPSRKSAYSPAAVLSLFCQGKPGGLWLNGLTLKRFGADSVSVEASGMARNSQTVFGYQGEVSGLSKSLPLTVLSMHPEVVATGGQPDTVLSFKLGATIHESPQTE